VRNTVRFLLANAGAHAHGEPVPRAQMGLAERYVMHRLRELEQIALEGYASFNFARGTRSTVLPPVSRAKAEGL
jgi:isoleucyl-tRNA synthetase